MIDVAAIRWVFFDVGCTLIDESVALEDRFERVAAALSARGSNVTLDGVRQAYEAAQREHVANAFVRSCELLSVDPQSLQEESRQWRKDLERPYPGAADVLRRVAARFRVGVIANQPLGTQQRLCQYGWGDHIALCISSTEETLWKPDPALYRLALQRANCAPCEAIMVGDRLDNDIRPAKLVGMATIRVLQGPAALQSPRDATETPDATVNSITDVPTLLGLPDPLS